MSFRIAFVLGCCLLLVGCRSHADPAGGQTEKPDSPSSPAEKPEAGPSTPEPDDPEPVDRDPLATAVARALSDVCPTDQQAQAFEESNIRDHAGPWKAFNVACVKDGQTQSLWRAWAPPEATDDPSLIAAEGRPLRRALVRQMIDRGADLRPVAELIVAVSLSERVSGVATEDPMVGIDTPDPAWQGKLRYPRLQEDGGLRLEFEAEDAQHPGYVRVTVDLDGDGDVDPSIAPVAQNPTDD